MTSKKELLIETQKAIGEYIELSKYLFSDDAPEQVNDIPSDNKFYSAAREIAEDYKVNWEEMKRSDSNRIMLELLFEYYDRINSVKDYRPVLTVSFQAED